MRGEADLYLERPNGVRQRVSLEARRGGGVTRCLQALELRLRENADADAHRHTRAQGG